LIGQFVTVVGDDLALFFSKRPASSTVANCKQALAYPDIISNLFSGKWSRHTTLSHDVGGLASGRPSAGCLRRENYATLR
jgi:hypothetical protein